MKKPDIQNLVDKYPKLFKQKSLDMTQTAMCWGIECGSGWYSILDCLCESIQNYADTINCDIEFTQIKEKFGSLRVYINYEDEVISALIRFAEILSCTTCEACGDTWNVRQDTGGYIQTLCGDCRTKRDSKYKLLSGDE